MLVFLSHSWTDKKHRSGESVNAYSWLNEHQHILVNNDKNRMKTLRMSAETETEVSPFLP